MKQKHPTLPLYIRKVNRFFYKDYKTGKLIRTEDLSKHCPKDEDLKHEVILSKRWDLNRD